MDRRSWLWRRKSSEKTPGETESSGSVSSISERFSDDQDISRASTVSASPNSAQSPDISTKIGNQEVHETVKSLNEKLSAALLSISAKEELVKQHTKVAEEAVAGWEKAENEVVALKQQLEVSAKKMLALEDRIGHLDGALKECVRQFRQSREEQEQKLHDALVRKSSEWETQKFELETRITELLAQLEARKGETTISIDHDIHLKLQALEQENSTLKAEILIAYEDLRVKTLERELSTRAAETASRQHLESIKKVAKVEAECRRLQTIVKRSSPFKDIKTLTNSAYVESLADSQSDNGERLFTVDNALSRSDSWASTLLAEFDQFKNDKVHLKNLTSSVDIDLMDDFLEMERLASLPEPNHEVPSFEIDADPKLFIAKENPSKVEFEALRCKLGELEEIVEKTTNEKREAEKVLSETKTQLKVSHEQLISAEGKLAELQRQLNSANGSKHAFEMEVESLESRKKELESQLGATTSEVKNLREKVGLLEDKSADFATKRHNIEALMLKNEQLELQLSSARLEVDKFQEKFAVERTLSAELASKCQNMEAIESEKMGLESKLISAQLEGEELQGKIGSLERELNEQIALCADVTAKVKDLEEQREALRSQLESVHAESGKLREKVRALENEVEAERALSSEFMSKTEALEANEKTLRSLFDAASYEAEKLRERTRMLETEVEREGTLSSGITAKCKQLEESEAKREEIESLLNLAHTEVGELSQKVNFLEGKVDENRTVQSQLESACLEVRKLSEKVNFMEREIEEERKLCSEFSNKCKSLKDELVMVKQEMDPRQPAISTGELKIKQEKELVVAPGKLTECQKTIASLSRQLKLLSDFDRMLETDVPELDEDKENFSIPNGLQRDLRLISVSTPLPGFAKCSSIRVENE